ncbi:Gfo/Idh/MocA family oxidoreductase [Aurantibacter crassamenti]|uniref:Gfo/Idh/MocA family protein n=1 Tax=Aurantibacter crassamenti TaxID=1837375 RepID=UPI0019399CC7|nr:Gfo/Idh/MocA family oxidoreductase [Aurantibacter crassamenti]MBM1107118.1 Gfo/Idh/MocA family oxidoreductase [Aurantibacter crassamenti]
MKNKIKTDSDKSRRSFIKKSGIALVGGSLIYPSGMMAFNTSNNDKIRIGLIGCGGRGTGAASQALSADPNTELVAMGDVFEDRLDGAYNQLIKLKPNHIKVDSANKFVGFDAYQKVIDSGVDVVLLTTPPAFRPDHLKAAIDAGKHAFCEKPVAVDAPGVQKVLAAAKMAKEKKLNVVSGFCFRHDTMNLETMSRVLGGDIGEIRAVTAYRNGGELWYKDRKPDWTNMTYQMRNWYYQNWLSGDFVVEQSVHSCDLISWTMNNEMPIKAIGSGGRQVRTDKKYGNIYDHFATEFTYANGAKANLFTRQQANTQGRNTVEAFGTEGVSYLNLYGKSEITGKKPWQYRGERNDMFQAEHDKLFAAIRSGNPINDGELMANSTMMGILSRMVGYTGQEITWEAAFNSKEQLGPNFEDYAWDFEFEMPEIAVPGKTKFH